MMRSRQRLSTTGTAMTLLLGLTVAAPSAAADIEQTERLTYSAMLGGLHVADLMVTLIQSEAGYSSGLEIVSRGVVRWVQDFRADINGVGGFALAPLPNGAEALQPMPVSFQREWTGGEFASAMAMMFDPDTREAIVSERLYNPLTGEDLSRDDMPWNEDERRENRKPVPEELRRNVLDPMGAFISARRQIMAQGGATGSTKSFRVPIYDGQRRYDIVGKTGPVRSTAINGKETAVVPVSLKLEPVFGFNSRSSERMDDVDSRLYFSADGRFIPLQATMVSNMFAIVINLQSDCGLNPAPCETFGQEPTP